MFPVKVLFVTVGLQAMTNMPPPHFVATFPEKVQFATVTLERSMSIPPAREVVSWGLPTSALPPVTVKPSRTAVASVPYAVTTW